MDELESLARALRTERPVVTDARLSRQRRRLLETHWAPRGAGARARSWGLGVAAGVVVLVAVALVWRAKPDSGASGPIAAVAPAPLDQALADGTRVRLDPAARGTLTRQASNLVRFDLTRGRAEFDVAKNPNRTFRVVAGDYEVVVLGTRFSVAYGPGERLAVAVERGAVSVGAFGQEPIRVSAGERLALEGSRVTEHTGAEPPQDPVPAASVAPEPPHERAVEKSESGSPLADWRRLYAERQYGAALEAARRAGIDHLVGTLGPRQLIELSDVARLGGDAALALRILGALERRFPNSAAGAEASFLKGRLLLQSGRKAEATAAFERYLLRSGRGVYTNEALGRLMELYAHRGESAKARAAAERYLSLAPNGPYQRLARSLTSGR